MNAYASSVRLLEIVLGGILGQPPAPKPLDLGMLRNELLACVGEQQPISFDAEGGIEMNQTFEQYLRNYHDIIGEDLPCQLQVFSDGGDVYITVLANVEGVGPITVRVTDNQVTVTPTTKGA
jgi:hypothetical protein